MATTTPPKSQKSTTKAERRELQEKQRAAKASQASTQVSKSSASSSKASPSTAVPTNKKAFTRTGEPPKPYITPDAKDMSNQLDNETRGLRIFAHFGLPKAVGHSIKGDIHPTVLKLALQFSEFRICGANARCIATLTAFKTVRSFLCLQRM
jgi:translation initiation factor eIF-2B subunit delta